MSAAAWVERGREAAALARQVLGRPVNCLLLALTLAGALVAAWGTQQIVQARREAAFREAAHDAAAALERRFADYAQILRGGAGLLQGSRSVLRPEWREYVSALRLPERFPDIQALAYAQLVDAAAVPALENRLRAEGVADFRVWPAGPRSRYAPVVLIEPFVGAHALSLGFDMLSEATRRAALDQALTSGEAVLSDVVPLASAGERDPQWGCLLYLPVFRPGLARAPLEERRAGLAGFVYVVFRLQDLLDGTEDDARQRVAMALYQVEPDGRRQSLSVEPAARDSDSELVAEIEIGAPGRTWLAHLHPTPRLLRETASALPLAVLGGGLLVVLSLFALFLLQARRGRLEAARAARLGDELRRGQERFQQVVEAMPVGMLIARTDGTIAMVNRQLAETFGYPEAELVGMPVDALLPSAARQAHARERQRYLEKMDARMMGHGRYLPGLRRDGRELALEIALSPLRAGGETLLLAMVQDVGQRRQHEQALAEARTRAEAANAAKSEFLANMSHEIRTPLNAVLGMAQLLDYTTLDARQRDYLRMIHTAGKSLLGLLNDILDFSKIEAGRFEVVVAPFRLAELLDTLRDLLSVSVRQKGLRFEMRVEPDVPALLEGDAKRLQQILLNLLGNAVKFTERGEVGLHVACLSRAGAACRLQFRVRDSGIGMAPEQLERLFAPFTQADGSSARRFGGSGLGLVISKRLVDMMGGEIGVRSTPGEGSEFWFNLSLQEADAAAPGVQARLAESTATPALPPLLTGLRVLLVEDDAINRTVARSLLEEAGVVVELAADGAQALQRLRDGPPACDLVLLDVQMPVMDGLEATRRIRREFGFDLPVIGMSAGVLPAEQAACAEAGMSDFVAKPLDAARLFAVLARFAPASHGVALGATAERLRAGVGLPADGVALPAIEGLTPGPALLRLGNKVSLYREVLSLFRHEAAGLVAAARTSLRDGDLTLAQRACHTFKSSAANVGANGLAALAGEAEQCLRQGDREAAGGRLETIAAELTRLLPRIDAALQTPSVPPAEPSAMAAIQFEQRLPVLLAALRANDFQAIELGGRLRPALVARLGEAAAGAFAEAVEQLDFERALAVLRDDGLA